MIDRTKVRRIQEKIQNAIAQIEKEENVSIEFGTRTFSETQYTTKMTVKSTATDTKTIKAVESENELLSKSYGFNKNIIGEKFTIQGKSLEVKSFKTRNRKYPIIAETIDGRSFKLSPAQIKGLIK
jgi:hypothetical protein